MIDLSSVKTPGWARIVAELHAPAPDDGVFLHKLVAILAQVSGARQAVLFAVEREGEPGSPPPDPRPIAIWPPAAGEGTPEVEQASEVRAAARSTAESGQLKIFGLEAESTYYGDPEKGSIIAAVVPSGDAANAAAGGPTGVVTLLLEPRSKQALQTTTALVEVLIGYTLLHATRQQLKRAKASTASLDLAARLIASVNTAPSFKGAAMQLVNDLSRQMRADRVAMGWVRGIGTSGAIRATAVSDTELIDRRLAMIQKIEAAMDECLDQEQAVLYPPPPSQGPQADVVLSTAITHAHRELAASDARLKVVSLPLRDGDRVVGVITLESTAEGPADLASIELVQAALDLLSPVLIVKRSDDRLLATRAALSAAKAGKWMVGPKHTGWKLAGVGLFVLLVASVVISIPYRVEAPMELQPRTKFTVAVPFDGVIGSIPKDVEAGRPVHKGDLLVQMDTTELGLQVLHGQAELDQALKERDEYQRTGKLGEAAQAQAKADEAEANLKQAKYNLDRAKVVSPIDGMIITGDLSDKVGVAAKIGEMLFQIAPLEDMVVVARVSDRDIALVHGGVIGPGEEPTTGDIATKASPSVTFPFTVERIVPLAQPKDGKNAFEVRGALRGKAAWLKPGLEGYAHFNTGRHSLIWIGTRRIRDQLRLWLWW